MKPLWHVRVPVRAVTITTFGLVVLGYLLVLSRFLLDRSKLLFEIGQAVLEPGLLWVLCLASSLANIATRRRRGSRARRTRRHQHQSQVQIAVQVSLYSGFESREFITRLAPDAVATSARHNQKQLGIRRPQLRKRRSCVARGGGRASTNASRSRASASWSQTCKGQPGPWQGPGGATPCQEEGRYSKSKCARLPAAR